jgi:hypothetical protein
VIVPAAVPVFEPTKPPVAIGRVTEAQLAKAIAATRVKRMRTFFISFPPFLD